MKLNVLVMLLLAGSFALGFPTYTGYSGAPGSQGACASACHGASGGSITIIGFPTAYTAGQAYTITVFSSGLSNFNCSVRIGSGSQTAGTITAGTNTATYNVSGEPNGVHLATPDHDNGDFTWTAPSPAVGAVTLYLAGHQNGVNGPNTEIALTAQASGIEEPGRVITPGPEFTVEPSVVTRELVLRTGGLEQAGSVTVYGRGGRVVARFPVPAGVHQAFVWTPQHADGQRVRSGVYFARLESAGRTLTRKFVVR